METKKQQNFHDIMQGILQNPYTGIIMVDLEGNVTIINQTYLELLGIKEEDAINRHVTDITPHSRLPEVLETKEVHLADHWRVNEHDTIVFRMPLYKDGQMIGAMGQSLVLDAAGVRILSKKLRDLEGQLAVYKDVLSSIYVSKYGFADIVGVNEQLRIIKNMAVRAANTGSTVLILGESGTGKELFAHAIHQASSRSKHPFVRVNCAAMPDQLLESELFGYDEGAFTGARKGGKPGKFELAHRGVIFLDEIGDMPLAMQAKLLAVLQEREIERVGGTKPISVDVQIIAATNRDLQEMVKQGLFREDLFFRLNVVTIHVPPLRERREDIPLLVNYLVPKLNRRMHTQVEKAAPETLEFLGRYEWPGNIRELENLLERAINMADLNRQSSLYPKHFPYLSNLLPAAEQMPISVDNLGEAVERTEKTTIMRVLAASGNNKARAARVLGINKSVLYRKLDKYDLLNPKD
ncbi:MAG: sigma 54-interacting transcriptional regulator [Syntrophomonadaceae bacterium]